MPPLDYGPEGPTLGVNGGWVTATRALRILLLALLLTPCAALAQRDTTRQALDRLEETLAVRVESGGLSTQELLPILVVSSAPAYEETRAWYPTAALATLVRVFGAAGLRACEACTAPRTWSGEGRLEQTSGTPDAQELIRMDELSRVSSAPARTALWLDETPQGVSLRVVSLRNSQVLIAENFDPSLKERARTTENVRLAQELDRRSRALSLTHPMVDLTIYPGQHLSLEWAEQWGDSNANLAGFAVSFFDPVLGVGASYHRILPMFFDVTVGAQVLLSVPTAIVKAVSPESSGNLFDPLVTGVLMIRVPLFKSNYAVLLAASTRGSVGVGISLLNFSVLPFLP